MAIASDDYNGWVTFRTMYGGNGDAYIILTKINQEGLTEDISYRMAMSGGNSTDVKVRVAMVNLYRAMEAAGMNEHPQEKLFCKHMGHPYIKENNG